MKYNSHRFTQVTQNFLPFHYFFAFLRHTHPLFRFPVSTFRGATNYWVAIRTSEESPIVVFEVNHKKDNTEIVGWYTLDKRNLEKIKKQAKREDGQLLILPSDFAEEVGALSDPTSGSLSGGKGSENFGTTKENGEKNGEDLRFRVADEESSRPRGPLRPGEGIFDRAEAVNRDYMAELERARKSREEALLEKQKKEREYIQTREVKRRVDAVARDDFDTNSPWWRTIKRDFQNMLGERGCQEIRHI